MSDAIAKTFVKSKFSLQLQSKLPVGLENSNGVKEFKPKMRTPGWGGAAIWLLPVMSGTFWCLYIVWRYCRKAFCCSSPCELVIPVSTRAVQSTHSVRRRRTSHLLYAVRQCNHNSQSPVSAFLYINLTLENNLEFGMISAASTQAVMYTEKLVITRKSCTE